MSNTFRLPKVNPLSVCSTTPFPQPISLALHSAAAAVSYRQTDRQTDRQTCLFIWSLIQ